MAHLPLGCPLGKLYFGDQSRLYPSFTAGLALRPAPRLFRCATGRWFVLLDFRQLELECRCFFRVPSCTYAAHEHELPLRVVHTKNQTAYLADCSSAIVPAENDRAFPRPREGDERMHASASPTWPPGQPARARNRRGQVGPVRPGLTSLRRAVDRNYPRRAPRSGILLECRRLCAQVGRIHTPLQCASRSPLARRNNTRATRRRTRTCSCLTRSFRLAAALPRSVSDPIAV